MHTCWIKNIFIIKTTFGKLKLDINNTNFAKGYLKNKL